MTEIVEFFKTVGRICKANNGKCDECPLYGHPCSAYINCISAVEPDKDIEEMVNIADRWAKDHPVKTRQSEFLKMFPNAPKSGRVLDICPQNLNIDYMPPKRCENISCGACKTDYWNEEVTDND